MNSFVAHIQPMIGKHKVAVVMPAYNAGKTLEKTYQEIPLDIVDEVILVDKISNLLGLPPVLVLDIIQSATQNRR